jgi:DNA-binding GntR family transcriptional regulator
MPIPKKELIQNNPMREKVYDEIRQWIMNGELAPGEKIRDKEIADALGVSRTPVREALRRLEDEGLIETAMHRWTRVSKVHVSDAERLDPIIGALEMLAIELALPHLTSADFEQMRHLNTQLLSAIQQGDENSARDFDTHFHEVIILKSNNTELINILKELRFKIKRVESIYFKSQNNANGSVEEHNQIISALEQRDVELARHAIRQNWTMSLMRLQAMANQDEDA